MLHSSAAQPSRRPSNQPRQRNTAAREAARQWLRAWLKACSVRVATITAAPRRARVDLGLLHPLVQRLRRTDDLGCDRRDRRPAGRVLMQMLLIQHQPDRMLADFRRKRVRRLAHDGSAFSGVGAPGKHRAAHSGYGASTKSQTRRRPTADISLISWRSKGGED